MKIWLKLAINEIVNNRRYSLLFVLNLSIGLMGFIALNSFNHSLHNYFNDNLKKILAADFIISSTQAFTREEDLILDNLTGESKTESRQITFFSMAAGPSSSRLTRIIAIDVNYPLCGQILLKDNRRSNPDIIRADLMDKAGIWMAIDTAISLGVGIGDTLKIGRKEFCVVDFVQEDPESAITGFEIAPRLYIGMDQLDGTELIKFGSKIDYHIYYRYPSGTDVKAITARLIKELNSDPERFETIELVDDDRISRRVGRAIDYFTGYMGLIGLVALFLSGIGAGYLFRSYLDKNLQQIAILMSLGASRFETYIMFFSQVILLGIISSIASSILSLLLLPVFPKILQGFLPSDLLIKTDLYSFFLALLLGAIGSIIFCLPVIIRIRQLKPLHLLKGYRLKDRDTQGSIYRTAAAFLPALLFFWFLTWDQAASLKWGTIFLGGFLCTAFILGLTGWLFMKKSRTLSLFGNVTLKISLRNIYRNKYTSVFYFLTIALGAYLLNIGPQIKNGIEEEISHPKGLMIPGFFLIDIQPEQVEQLKEFLKNNNYKLTNVSPLISGVITGINGKTFNQWMNRINGKKNYRESRKRNQEFNFSYRFDLDSSESIILGNPLIEESYDFESGKPAQISIAENFANRYGLKLDDILEFEIQGIPISGQVVNIRDVSWNSFQPNFNILFQPGVLEEAPKMFLASIPQMGKDERLPLQNAIVAKFPNISMIDVSRMVENILAISDRISLSMRLIAYISIVAGLIVIFSIARQETQSRLWEINLLKVLGAGFRDIRLIIIFEFGILGLIASMSGVMLSIISSFIISYYYFERLWVFRIEYAFFSILAVCMICALTAITAAGKTIKQRPLSVLQAV